ncbi:MAG: hypothetical protein JNJ88_07720 [Planctomycetes bacterium]|nr:hypothetical protein [Planctomycetota bacterium]
MAALGILTIALLYVWLSRDMLPTSPVPHSNDRAEESRPKESLPASVAFGEHARSETSHRPVATIAVRDEEGEPISQARICEQGAAKRRISLSPDECIASSAGKEPLVLDEERIRSIRTNALSVTAPGFLPQQISLNDIRLGQTSTIVLQRGASIRIRCVDLAGNPVSGAHAAASRAALPFSWKCAITDAPAPAGDARYSIHEAWTDDAGFALLSGLQSEVDYEVQVDVEDHVVFSQDEQDAKRAGPRTYRYTASTLLGAAVTAAPSPLASASFIMEDDLISLPRARVSGAERIRREFSDRHPGCSVILCARRRNLDSEPSVSLLAVFEGGEEIRRTVPLKPLRLAEALVLDSSSSKQVLPSKQIRIFVEDRHGNPLSLDTIRLMDQARGFVGRTILVRPGEVHTVPLGKWNITSSDGTVHSLLEPRKLEIRDDSPDSLRLILQDDIRRCQIRVYGAGGLPVDRLFLRIVTSDGGEQRIFMNDVSSRALFLKVGMVTLEGRAFGFGTGSLAAEITGTITDQPQVLELELQE